jgi:lysophospholipase L1-like esterase
MAWRSETVFPQFAPSQTCRFTAQLSGGGSELRAEFTSPDAPGDGYTILDASVASSTGDGLNVQATTATQLTFSGRSEVRVAAGSRVLSDPVAFPTTSSSRIAVTITASAGEAPTTPNAVDLGACTPSPLATATAGTAPGELFSQPSHLMWLRTLQVYGPPPRSIAGLGDSITVSPQLPLHLYWTDVLDGHNAAVINAGVGGGYLTAIGMYGTAVGLDRLDDLLAEPGLTDVVMLLGTNDLGVGVASVQLLNAVATALHNAQVKHVRLWVCTIIPRVGSLWSPGSELERLAFNDALRSAWLPEHGGQLIDTDAALRDPADPGELLAVYDSGDHVHPSAEGAHELGITIGLTIGLLI